MAWSFRSHPSRVEHHFSGELEGGVRRGVGVLLRQTSAHRLLVNVIAKALAFGGLPHSAVDEALLPHGRAEVEDLSRLKGKAGRDRESIAIANANSRTLDYASA